MSMLDVICIICSDKTNKVDGYRHDIGTKVVWICGFCHEEIYKYSEDEKKLDQSMPIPDKMWEYIKKGDKINLSWLSEVFSNWIEKMMKDGKLD